MREHESSGLLSLRRAFGILPRTPGRYSMQKRTLPAGAYCARCSRPFTSIRQYRFDPLLDRLAICRRECSLLPHATTARVADGEGRFKVPGGVWEGDRFVAVAVPA